MSSFRQLITKDNISIFLHYLDILKISVNLQKSFYFLCVQIFGLNSIYLVIQIIHTHNDPKFSDSQAWVNSADPDQTAPRGAVCSGSTLFAIPSASFGHITLW